MSQVGATWPASIDTLSDEVQRQFHRPVQSQPADPTAITGTTEKMLGLAIAFTPRRTGRIKVHVVGNITCDTTAKTTTVAMKYGTGTAPMNDAADAGTAAISTFTRAFTALTGMVTVPFADVALISGLTIGIAYWIDYNCKTDDGAATGRLLGLNVLVEEI